MKIAQGFVQELLNKVDIVALVSRTVPLKKAGANFVGCCPFHTEKTPSFTVSVKKQFYHCFGCGAHGDAINFVTQQQGVGFTDAVEILAKAAGVLVPRTKEEEKNIGKRSQELDVLHKVADFYVSCLKKNAEAINYLKGRGITGQVAKRFALGFAPVGWQNLAPVIKELQTTEHQLIDAGLLINKEGSDRPYCRFRGRIIFPIRDFRGRVIGFGGRVMDSAMPKYLNSPETDVFHKGNNLYGIFEALSNHRLEVKELVVVEGYMDVIALAQYEITSVATLGTAVTVQHIEQLFRYDVAITFCFDGDRAGYEAALKAMLVTLPVMQDGKEIKFMFLEEGEDPDSYVRKHGKEGFLQLQKRACPLSEFVFLSFSNKVSLDTLDGRAKFVDLAKPLLELMPNSVFKEMMYEKLSKLAKIRRYNLDGKKTKELEKKINLPPSPVKIAIVLLCEQACILTKIKLEDLNYLQVSIDSEIVTLLKLIKFIKDTEYKAEKEQILAAFVEDRYVQEAFVSCEWLALLPLAAYSEELAGALSKVNNLMKQQEVKLLLDKSKQISLNNHEQQRLKELLS